jgi:hypothetical protein
MAWALWVAVVSAQLAASDRGCIQARALRLSARLSSDDFGSSVVRRARVKCYRERVFRMPWEHGGGLGSVHWREDRISLLRFGYRTAQDVTGRHRGLVGPAMADLAAAKAR